MYKLESHVEPDSQGHSQLISGVTPMRGARQAISTDDAIQVLCDDTRRTLLRYLIQSEAGTETVNDMASALVADETICACREDIELALYHLHLPKLAEAGVIEWEPDVGTVRYLPNDSIETLLDGPPPMTE